MQIHPIAIYNREDTHFGQYTQHSFKMQPRKAMPHTMLNKSRPPLSLSESRQIGV